MTDAFTPLRALGLMSGTSMDGIDAAILTTDGEAHLEFGPAAEYTYRDWERDAIAVALQNGFTWRVEPDARLIVAEQAVIEAHASASARLLRRADAYADVIGFHGQTIAHDPAAGWTWQIGNGAALAQALNRPVVWDFRSADMRAGGEGAPLAPFFHFALAKHIGAEEPLAFLNIGGVANVTWVDPRKSTPEEDGALLAFDTGPGNALLNDWMARHGHEPLDRDGAMAAQGSVDAAFLHSNAAGDFLSRKPPKSLDRNDFSLVLDRITSHSLADGAATLTALTAQYIDAAQAHMPSPPSRWLVCGGGRRNPVMMGMVAKRLDAPVEAVEKVGLNGDMLEAQAFAYLAVRALRGLPLSATSTTACKTAVTGGRISAPPRLRPVHLPSS